MEEQYASAATQIMVEMKSEGKEIELISQKQKKSSYRSSITTHSPICMLLLLCQDFNKIYQSIFFFKKKTSHLDYSE